jgi:hypothetical protein
VKGKRREVRLLSVRRSCWLGIEGTNRRLRSVRSSGHWPVALAIMLMRNLPRLTNNDASLQMSTVRERDGHATCHVRVDAGVAASTDAQR